LGQTLETVFEMTTLEFTGWAAFYKLEAAETKKAMDRAKRGRP